MNKNNEQSINIEERENYTRKFFAQLVRATYELLIVPCPASDDDEAVGAAAEFFCCYGFWRFFL